MSVNSSTRSAAPRGHLPATASRLVRAEDIRSARVDRTRTEAKTTRATPYRPFRGKNGLLVDHGEGPTT